MRFRNRADAGRRLAGRLELLRDENVVVLGLPRGGVPVAYEVATSLAAPLDVIVVRKLGVPFQPEVAMGAIGEDDTVVLNPDVLRMTGVEPRELREVQERERAEVARRVRRFRGQRPGTPLRGRTAVIIDDGVATGATAKAACQVARAQGAGRVVLAVPVASAGTVAELSRIADEVVCVETPQWLQAIGEWYEDFSQTPDEEVVHLLDRARSQRIAALRPGMTHRGYNGDVTVSAGSVTLPGHLTVPTGAPGLVVFVHGSGSSRHSPRNQYVAGVLQGAGLGTLLFDLLTAEEETVRGNVFDIDLLAYRLLDAIGWLRSLPATIGMPVALFGASTGAAAALWAAAEPDVDIAAVVSRGGRADLAASRLSQVHAPTLLIVGGLDEAVLRLNHAATALLHCEHELAVVPGATHLFEEPGTLERVSELARDWFLTHLPAKQRAAAR